MRPSNQTLPHSYYTYMIHRIISAHLVPGFADSAIYKTDKFAEDCVKTIWRGSLIQKKRKINPKLQNAAL